MAGAYQVGGRFDIDISEIEADLDALDQASPRVFRNIGQRLRIEGSQLLVTIFEEALADLDEDQMGEPVKQAMLENAAHLPINVSAGAQGVTAEVDFEALGSRADLIAGFHYHALLKSKGFVELPYGGEEMYNDDAEIRYEFVNAMMTGDVFETVKGRPIETAGLWDETQQARAEFWGDISPAWLYLEFGQEDWEPHIEPKDITGQFREAFSELGSAIFAEEWESVIAHLQEYEEFGAEETFGGRLRVPAGEYPIINGKQFKPGQLLPRL